jgi:hypothetical protein
LTPQKEPVGKCTLACTLRQIPLLLWCTDVAKSILHSSPSIGQARQGSAPTIPRSLTLFGSVETDVQLEAVRKEYEVRIVKREKVGSGASQSEVA